MTTKEFQRRLQYFKSLDRAAMYFGLSNNINSIFKITLTYTNKSVLYDYSVHCNVSDIDSDNCEHIWFDRFTFEEFEVQFKYFHAFLLRLSYHQLSVVKANLDNYGLTHLFAYLSKVCPNGSL